MAKKISYNEFYKRFYQAHPDCNFEIIGYTAITKPVDIVCKKCGKKYHYITGNRAISGYGCCQNNERKIDKIIKWLDKNEEFDFIAQKDCENIIVRHNKCGNTYKKNIGKFFTSPNSCKFCKNKNLFLKNSLHDAQKHVDELFNGQIELLNYQGRHEKTTYRCLKCGQIFTQKYDCLLGSAGCPKCDRRKSQGEKLVKRLLAQNNVFYKEQVGVSELPRQHFDFCVYKDKNCLVPEYFIEVQGEQHYNPVKYWGGKEKFLRNQELDNKKREYCKKQKLPLYELVYVNKKILNLDILPFSSTTTSAKEGTSEANADGNDFCHENG